MHILFAAPENAWGGFLSLIRTKLPHHTFTATGRFEVAALAATGADRVLDNFGDLDLALDAILT